jgi:sodium/proline symporter
MCVIIGIPLYLLPGVGGLNGIDASLISHRLTNTLIPDFSGKTIVSIISMALGWGLGYFGQPHIVTKFMGIKNVSEISKSKWIGMTWMVLSLGAATLVGAVAVAFFNGTINNPELVFIEMVKKSFHPFIVGFVLCAVIATTINAMSSQVLVLSSSLTEDFYKKLFRKDASSKELLLVSRLGVVLAAFVAYLIAFKKTSTIYALVLYAWSGIGASFGPLVILSLYSRKINKFGAWAGILAGALMSGFWPFFKIDISPLIPGFIISFVLILAVSHLTRQKGRKTV